MNKEFNNNEKTYYSEGLTSIVPVFILLILSTYGFFKTSDSELRILYTFFIIYFTIGLLSTKKISVNKNEIICTRRFLPKFRREIIDYNNILKVEVIVIITKANLRGKTLKIYMKNKKIIKFRIFNVSENEILSFFKDCNINIHRLTMSTTTLLKKQIH